MARSIFYVDYCLIAPIDNIYFSLILLLF